MVLCRDTADTSQTHNAMIPYTGRGSPFATFNQRSEQCWLLTNPLVVGEDSYSMNSNKTIDLGYYEYQALVGRLRSCTATFFSSHHFSFLAISLQAL